MPASMSPESDQNEDFFNSPVQRGSNNGGNANDSGTGNGGGANDSVPRPKRIACILCRKRKLKCDGNKPSCGTCSRLGHSCEYSEERKKSGPKRGYVKLLEARLKQVENLLETHTAPESSTPSSGVNSNQDKLMMPVGQLPNMNDATMQGVMQDPIFVDPALDAMPDFGLSSSDDYCWEMIGLGLEEALPNQDVIDELNQIYFEKIHPSLPMIHRGRFLAAMDLAPHMRPAVCLRYAMWTHACSVTSKYSAYTEHFYTRARKYAEQDEIRSHGEGIATLAHSQCWTLLACHEFKMMYLPRAWMSIGKATRLAQMMGLHRQDRTGLDVKQTIPPPRDWVEREERRRTFWMAFCQDRYASIGTGWPMLIDEQDILTNLPASEEAFNKGKPEQTQPLSEVMNGDGAASLSSFGGVILLATLFGRNLTHLHRPTEKDNDYDLNGEFWKRHRTLDNVLLNISLSMPVTLRLPSSIHDPNAVFCNMNIHTATICLHQAAIFKADKNQFPAQISAESKRRCIVAADQITNIMKMISHMDLSVMNPFLAFCLYLASRVFVQYLKSRREDTAVTSSLHFLLSAMQVLKTKNPLTESFLVQLDIDLEGSGLDILSHSRYKFGRRPPGEIPANTDSLHCSPLFEIRESQAQTDKSSANGSYRSTHAQASPIRVNNCAKVQSLDHLPNNVMDGVDLLYGQSQPYQQQQQNNNTTPEFITSTSEGHSSSSHSNHPTPSTMSNRASSYAGYTPPQNTYSGFSTTAGPSLGDQLPFVGGNNSNNNITTANSSIGSNASNNLASSSWTAVPSYHSQPVQQQQNMPTYDSGGSIASGSGGGTGMTPGATGMTPLPDSLWQSVNDGNDWYGWNAGTPNQQ